MTPKEKAEKIYYKYYQQVTDCSYPEDRAKECALIAVDEVLRIVNIWSSLNLQKSSQVIFWEQVKQEIEQL